MQSVPLLMQSAPLGFSCAPACPWAHLHARIVHFEKPRCTWEVGPVENHTTPGASGSTSTATGRTILDYDLELSGTCTARKYATGEVSKAGPRRCQGHVSGAVGRSRGISWLPLLISWSNSCATTAPLVSSRLARCTKRAGHGRPRADRP